MQGIQRGCLGWLHFWHARALFQTPATFTHGQCSKQHLLMDKVIQKAAYLTDKAKVFQCADGVYMVPSSSDDSVMHEVAVNISHCSCEVGKFGKFYKHLCVVHQLFGNAMPNAPAVMTACCYEVVRLALGDKAVPEMSFYGHMMETAEAGTSASISSTTIEPIVLNLHHHRHCLWRKLASIDSWREALRADCGVPRAPEQFYHLLWAQQRYNEWL